MPFLVADQARFPTQQVFIFEQEAEQPNKNRTMHNNNSQRLLRITEEAYQNSVMAHQNMAAQEVIQGVPILAHPNVDIFNYPFYISGTVTIPPEIQEPFTIGKLTLLNTYIRHHFFGGVIQGPYIQGLQRELDVTSAELLSHKLDALWEVAHFYFNFRGGVVANSPLEKEYFIFLFS